MKKFEILVPIGCRSDEGLSQPIIKRLQNADWCNVTTIPLVPVDYSESYKKIEKHLSLYNYDLVLITGDRIEMAACAQACFLNRIKIAHLYAGIIDYSFVLFDDILRHQITLTSDIQFCESEVARKIVENLLISIGKKPNAYVVGITHLDDVEVDESLVPNEEYNLILVNKTTLINEIPTFIVKDNKKTIVIGSNPDGCVENIKEWANFWKYCIYYENLDRAKFLGLLSKCSTYYTNSSSAYYEAPEWLKPEQIVMIGERNKRRNTSKNLQKGASDKIVDILHQLHLKGEFD